MRVDEVDEFKFIQKKKAGRKRHIFRFPGLHMTVISPKLLLYIASLAAQPVMLA